MTRRAAVIVAGGSGSRMGSATPKQFLLLHQRPILMHTIEAFASYCADIQIIVVLPAAQATYWQQLCQQYNFTLPHTIAFGGDTRFASVKNGLQCVNNNCELVAVHDGVRPLVSRETIDRCFNLAATQKAAVPVLPSVESVRMVDDMGKNTAVDRQRIMLVQTPQVFDYKLLLLAYGQQYTPLFTDDASVVEALGTPIALCPGNPENIKITTPKDLIFAENAIGN